MKFDAEKAVKCSRPGCNKRTMNDDGVCSVCAYIGEYDKGNGKKKAKAKPRPDNGGTLPASPAPPSSAPETAQDIPPGPTETHQNPKMDTSGPRVPGDTRFPVLSCEAITLTHPKAKALLKFNTYEAQRKLKARNLRDLEAAISEGRWRSADISIAVLPSGREILVNGQHTLTACVNTTRHIFVMVLRYAVKAELKACKLDWPLLIASLITSAAACIETGSFRHNLGKARQSALVRDYKKRGAFVVTLYDENKDGFRHLRRGPVVTAIVRSYMVSPDAAWTFWCNVRDGGVTESCPSQTLRQYLMEQPETWDRQALYNKCVEHYNAFAGPEAGIAVEKKEDEDTDA